MKKVRWEEMFPDEMLAAIEEHPVVYMAYGLAEPHGPYNALGLDWLKAQSLCERAAREHGGIVAPPFCWHVQEMPAFDWPGYKEVKQSLCSSIPGDLFLRMLFHQLRVFDARGFHAAILVTGHYGGIEKDMRLAAEFYTRCTHSPMQIRCLADCEVIDFEGYKGDHAGMTETQQLMALHPHLVDLSLEEPSPKSGKWAGKNFAKAGKTPLRETGEGIVASQMVGFGRIEKELLANYKPVEGWKAPGQAVVENIWHGFERSTRKYWIASTSLVEFYNGNPAPPFPGWDALGV